MSYVDLHFLFLLVYFTTDKFSGYFVPLMESLLGKYVKQGFEDAAAALKQRAERLHAEQLASATAV